MFEGRVREGRDWGKEERRDRGKVHGRQKGEAAAQGGKQKPTG